MPTGTTEILDVNDVIVGELAERGYWVVANIQTNSYWPMKAQKVSYRGVNVWIMPVMKNYFPAVALKVLPGKSKEECERLLMRFISTLSWVEGKGFLVDGVGGGSLPSPMWRDKERGFSLCEEFETSYFPEPTNERAMLALALMREGRGLNHPGYAFLSFYRVLEAAFPDGRRRRDWIAGNVDSIQDHLGGKALEALRAKGVADVGTHLFESGRCAVAHAKEEPIIDPDDPSDARRLWDELPIMAALAEMAIEQELGVETAHTIWRKHLYELAGFKEMLGADTVAYLQRGEPVTDQRMVDVPVINVQIRGKMQYAPLTGMIIKAIGQDAHVFHMGFESEDKRVTLQLHADFRNDRLHFDWSNGITMVPDDGGSDYLEAMAEIQRFQADYFGNGRLEIYNAETGALISRKDAFLPVNMFLDQEAAHSGIEKLKVRAAERRAETAR
jgi:hypothetical protein